SRITRWYLPRWPGSSPNQPSLLLSLEPGGVERRGDETYLHRNLVRREPLHTMPTHPNHEVPARLGPRQHDGCDDDLPGDGVRLPMHDGICDTSNLEQHIGDLGWEDLLASYIDDLVLSSKEAEPFPVHFDKVTGIEKPVRIERTRRVQVAKHG